MSVTVWRPRAAVQTNIQQLRRPGGGGDGTGESETGAAARPETKTSAPGFMADSSGLRDGDASVSLRRACFAPSPCYYDEDQGLFGLFHRARSESNELSLSRPHHRQRTSGHVTFSRTEHESITKSHDLHLPSTPRSSPSTLSVYIHMCKHARGARPRPASGNEPNHRPPTRCC